MTIFRLGFLAITALFIGSNAEATLFYSATSTAPIVPSGMGVSVPLSGITPNVVNSSPITLSNGVLVDLTGDAMTLKYQGVVQGVGAHSIPVAAQTGTTSWYLTGDYGSALTSNIAASGNYLSTGLGTISIDFGSTELSSFVLLWGSIDPGNALEFLQGNTEVGSLTGSQILAGPQKGQHIGGGLYVAIDSDIAFNKILMTSSTNSFEAADLEGDIGYLDIPEPASLAIVGAGLIGLMAARRRDNV